MWEATHHLLTHCPATAIFFWATKWRPSLRATCCRPCSGTSSALLLRPCCFTLFFPHLRGARHLPCRCPAALCRQGALWHQAGPAAAAQRSLEQRRTFWNGLERSGTRHRCSRHLSAHPGPKTGIQDKTRDNWHCYGSKEMHCTTVRMAIVRYSSMTKSKFFLWLIRKVHKESVNPLLLYLEAHRTSKPTGTHFWLDGFKPWISHLSLS